MVYGIDEHGCVWAAKGDAEPRQLEWMKVENPYKTTSHGQTPQDPGDDTPSWRDL